MKVKEDVSKDLKKIKKGITKAPTILVIFGATGNLMKQKVLPALYHLFKNNQLPSLFSIYCLSNEEYTTKTYQDFVKKHIKKHLGNQTETDKKFIELFTFQKGFFENKGDYKEIAKRLGQIDENWSSCSNKLFYLAVRPNYFEIILRNLAEQGLTKACSLEKGWTRVLVEKPFGNNVGEFLKLDKLLSNLFVEEQIFRIDHYLAKEILQNVFIFRFANNFMENSWNNKFIDKIHIRILENKGIDGRGGFYDGLGALLDVGQNHVLQMLAAVTMENPLSFDSKKIKDKKIEVLQNLRVLKPKEIKTHTYRGQYKGYKKEVGVHKNSTTETYFNIKTFIDTPRWQGVPIYLEGGKQMPYSDKEVLFKFRHPSPCLCSVLEKHYNNYVQFRLEPNPGISIKFWSKKPGPTMEAEGKWLNFKYKTKGHSHDYLEEYPRLLLDAIAGDQTLFASSQESILGLEFIEPIIAGWQENLSPLHEYGNDGKILINALQTLKNTKQEKNKGGQDGKQEYQRIGPR